ncbi:MAG: FAD-binding protein [Thermodesulfobacteriota bacterium]
MGSQSGCQMLETDVLVVGAGLGGCWAALRASELVPRVILVDKGMVGRSGTAVFCHDILAPMPEGELDDWLKEMVEHTEYISDQDFLKVWITEGGKRIADLRAFGVPFETDEKGDLFLSLGRGHKKSRVVLCDCRTLMEVMREQLLARKVKLVERVMTCELLTSDGQHPSNGRVVGALGIHGRSGEAIAFKAKAVVLATGLAGFKMRSSYADNITGDGQAMAFRAGAALANLEFGFGPRFCGFHRGRLITQSLMPFQTQGAYIVNADGERFMGRYVPERGERRSTFGLLAQAWAKETMEGRGPIYFDMRHFTKEHIQQLRRILPIRIAPLDEAGIDPSRDLIEARPVVAYFGGGIHIDIWGQSDLPALLAVGNCAQFPGAAERLSGGMLSICNVFGYRAGEQAARIAQEPDSHPVLSGQLNELKAGLTTPAGRKSGIRPYDIFRRLHRKLLRPEFTIVKNESTINEMLKDVRATKEILPQVFASDTHELIKANEARNFLDLLEPLYLACLERTESRLSHYRLDFSYRDDLNWLKWILVKKEEQGLNVVHKPVPIERYPIQPQDREKIPAIVKFSLSQTAD